MVLTDIKAKKAASVDTSGAKTNSDASISLASKAVIKVDQSVSYDAILIEDTTMPVVRLHRYSFGTVKGEVDSVQSWILLNQHHLINTLLDRLRITILTLFQAFSCGFTNFRFFVIFSRQFGSCQSH